MDSLEHILRTGYNDTLLDGIDKEMANINDGICFLAEALHGAEDDKLASSSTANRIPLHK